MITRVLDGLTTETITVDPQTHLLVTGVLTKGWTERQTLTINLSGEGASVDCFFASVGADTATFSFDIVIEHNAARTHSSVHMRTVLCEASRIDSKGYVRIGAQASGSDTYFAHHVLLLSPKTHAYILPSLEIEHNNVQAGHAVTIGRVEEEILFYCASRGISASDAAQLIMRGFLLADTKLIRDTYSRELFEHKIDSALSYAEQQ